ncbi:amidase [Ralstonia phage DU_RP_I]|uniref:N-acetylmuramoyl-L-alanine amidase n=1 Tax=Ralstonia phage DU_RP_I TaxID=2041493 RepID=A0A2D2W4Z1_9CAUD|nr:amidase [Ralstonia phage DU_RP_I]ATS93369.1 N-acetylmuramoyl-L-alanine amidase [Ralstonia phage DU_RP_I]
MAYTSNTKKRASTDYLVVHCSATKPSADIGAADIDRWHRKQGWRCIGYHFVIRRDGTIEEGRDADVIGAHVEGHNENSLGICLAGGVSEKDVNVAKNNFTPEQFASLQKLLTDLRAKYPKAIIQGHRDFPGVAKACPSFSAKGWAKQNGF